METLSFIVLLLLSLVAYSGGAVGKAGKYIDLKPQIFDLVLVLFIWAGAIYSRIALDLNKWLMILIWVILSAIIGSLTILLRKQTRDKSPYNEETEKLPSNPFKKIWESWKNFSLRMGSFQSRVMLSLFFFVFVSPFGLAVKIFSDPLRIKHHSSKSHWIPKKEIETDIDQYRKQF